MNRIAILYICTGPYVVFWKDFYESIEHFFLNNSYKEYFIFTDEQKIPEVVSNKRIHLIFQENLGWPGNTLKRYDMFCRIESLLDGFDYVFFFNANALCVNFITEEEFLPENEGLLVVQHPGFFNKKPKNFTYERNPLSTAFIPLKEGKYYVCGGINGGRRVEFLCMCRILADNIKCDEENGILAIWHDESHLNRFIINTDKYKCLSPAYCYPEGWELPFKPKVLIREKSKYIDVNSIKNISRMSCGKKIILKIDKILKRVVQ